MDYKKEIQTLLDLLKSLGIQRSQIEKDLDYAEKYITQQLAKGGNERLYKAILKYRNNIIHRMDAKSNPSKDDVQKDVDDFRMKYYEVLERERKALEDDKAFFKEILRSSLAVILQEQQRIASRQKGTGEVVLHSLERLEHKKKGQLVTEADKRIFQIDTEVHKPDNEVVPHK